MPIRFAHFRPHSKEMNEMIWNESLIVPDTNILLHMYRLDEKQRAILLKVLSADKIKTRLWFPHQVAKEFFRNRRGVISEQHQVARKAEKDLKSAFSDLETKLKVGRKNHPYFQRDSWITKLKTLQGEFVIELNNAREAWPASLGEDSFLASLEALMGGRLGNESSTSNYEAWTKDAKDREGRGENYPGRRDANNKEKLKDPDRGLGDFFIWNEMLEKAKEEGKHVIFVTDDGKDDWWEEHGGQKMGAHPEYRQEWSTYTKTEFVLCGFERFIQWANTYIAEKIEGQDLSGLLKTIRTLSAYQLPVTIPDTSLNVAALAKQIANMNIPSNEMQRSMSLERLDYLENMKKAIAATSTLPPNVYKGVLSCMLAEEVMRHRIEKEQNKKDLEPLPLTTPPDNPSKDDIVKWFFENFEDPGNGVPHDSSEGGYQYIFGGPWDAEEEINNTFYEVDEDILREATEEIETHGFEWVRKGLY